MVKSNAIWIDNQMRNLMMRFASHENDNEKNILNFCENFQFFTEGKIRKKKQKTFFEIEQKPIQIKGDCFTHYFITCTVYITEGSVNMKRCSTKK